MTIQNAFPEQPLTQEVEHRFLGRDGIIERQTEPVLREHSVKALVNGKLEMDFVCLPQFLPELIIGHLVTEGYLHRAEDVVSLSISPVRRPRETRVSIGSRSGSMEGLVTCEALTSILSK